MVLASSSPPHLEVPHDHNADNRSRCRRPVFPDVEQYALAAFLAGYRGLTRDAYALDLRQFIAWCDEHHVRLLGARRAHIECFARDLEVQEAASHAGPRATMR